MSGNERPTHPSTEVLADPSPHTRISPTRARLTVIRGRDKGRSLDLEEGQAALVGSDPACDLRLSDPAVSRRHLRVTRRGAQALVEDLGSTNGTFYGDARVESVRVGFGAELDLGRSRLRFVPAEEPMELTPSEETTFGELIGRDRKMREIFALLADVAPTDATIIIEGETGTGKELVARALHAHSLRRRGPFEVFDCSSVQGDLVASALFGHVKGAFTGATQTRAGVFERAQGGTVFLDEIGELDLSLQPKLLRVLEAREVQRVGGDEWVPVDVRVVAATNRPLRAAVREGRFRQDLYYRLAVVKVVLPPLRTRLDDLPLLVESFLERLNAPEEKRSAILSEANLQVLREHRWPGNVRELRNLVERAVHLGRPPKIALRRFLQESEEDLGGPFEAGPQGAGETARPRAFKEAKRSMVDAFEREYLLDVLQRNGGNISAAAREAGIDRKHFRELMKKHGVE